MSLQKIHEVRDLARSAPSTSSTPTTPPASQYKCHICGFQSNRQNVIILHIKSHSSDSFKTTIRKVGGGGGVPAISMQIHPVKRAQKMKIIISDSETDESIKELIKTPVKRGRKRKTQQQEIAKKKDSSDSSDVPSKKIKSDVELKYKILAEWSDDPETSSDIDEGINNSVVHVIDENEKSVILPSEKVIVPAAPVVTKYRNIPKKERREFVIEENNVVLIETTVTSPVREICNDLEPELKIEEKEEELSPEPISRQNSKDSINIPVTINEKPRRYTRKSRKSSSEDEIKKEEVFDLEKKIAEIHEEKIEPEIDSIPIPEPMEEIIPEPVISIPEPVEEVVEEVVKVVEEEEIKSPEITIIDEIITDDDSEEHQPSRNDISCFDFNEEDDEEIVVPKTPPRRRKRTSIILNNSEEDLDEKDKELTNEIDSLLNNTVMPVIQFLKSEEDIENKNRTLPPKERGKRIFKSRNRNFKSPETVSPTKSETDLLPEDTDCQLKENGNHLKIEETTITIESTTEICINAAEVLVHLSETVLNNSQNITTTEEKKEIENISSPVSRKKHLLKAEVENNGKKPEMDSPPPAEEIIIKPQSPSAYLSLSPKQKFVQKHKEHEEIAETVQPPIKPVVLSPSKQRKPSKPPQKLIKNSEQQLVKPIIVEDPTFLNDANFEQIKPKVHKTKKILNKRKIPIPDVLFNQGPIFNASQMVITSKGAIITTQTPTTSTISEIQTKQRVSDSSKKCIVSHSSSSSSSSSAVGGSVLVQSQEIIKKPTSSTTTKKISHSSKRSIKRCRMTPEELDEMKLKGFIKSMPNGPVLTAEGYKSMREKKIQNPIKISKLNFDAAEKTIKLINSPELPPLVPLTPSPKKQRRNSDDLITATVVQTDIPSSNISTSPSDEQTNFSPEIKSPEQSIILQDAEITEVSQEKYIAVQGN